jgi:hypothetical protein
MISKTGGVIGIISYLTRISTLKRLKNKEKRTYLKKIRIRGGDYYVSPE